MGPFRRNPAGLPSGSFGSGPTGQASGIPRGECHGCLANEITGETGETPVFFLSHMICYNWNFHKTSPVLSSKLESPLCVA